MSYQDWQFSSEPIVTRMSLHKFSVSQLLRHPDGPAWNHPLYANCEYCHKEIAVHLYASLNVAKYVKDEARRLAMLQHLRLEHVKEKSDSEISN